MTIQTRFLNVIVSLIIGFLTMLLFLLAETLFNFLKKKRRDNNKSQKAADETKKAERIAYTVLAMLCNEAAVFWLYIVAMSFIYNNSIMRMGVFSIETVWDFHSLSFPAGWAFLVFPLLCLAAVILITVSIFKKRIGRKFALWTAVLTTSAFLAFVLIPVQSYLIPLYSLIRQFELFKYAKVIFGALTAAVAVFNVLFAVRKPTTVENPAA